MDLSFWEKDVFFPQFDALILGSGIVGMNAAIRLRELHPSWKIAIVERGTLPLGASTRNAGFACFGSPTELLDDLQKMSPDELCTLVEKRFRGIQLLRQRLGDERIGFQALGGFESFLPEDQDIFEAVGNRLDEINKLLQPIFKGKPFIMADQKRKELGLTNFIHLISAPFEGTLHPGKMTKALLTWVKEQNISLFNGLEIDKVEPEKGGICLTTKAGIRLHSHRVLLCTNGFTQQLMPELELKAARNQVILTEPIPHLKLKGCFHYKEGYVYFRNVKDRILLGGFRHLSPGAETTSQFGFSPIIQDALENFLNTHLLPDQKPKITHRWSGIMGVGSTKAPIVQQVKPHIWTAVRLGGMGVAIGTQVGIEAAEMMSK